MHSAAGWFSFHLKKFKNDANFWKISVIKDANKFTKLMFSWNWMKWVVQNGCIHGGEKKKTEVNGTCDVVHDKRQRFRLHCAFAKFLNLQRFALETPWKRLNHIKSFFFFFFILKTFFVNTFLCSKSRKFCLQLFLLVFYRCHPARVKFTSFGCDFSARYQMSMSNTKRA